MLILDRHWYASTAAFNLVPHKRLVQPPHITPDGKGVFVCDVRGAGVIYFVMQGADGHDLLTKSGQRVEFTPGQLPDLERLVEFDHLPEARKAGSWMKPGSKLA